MALERRVQRTQIKLAAAQTELKEWSERLASERNTIQELPEQIIRKTNRLKEVQTNLDQLSNTDRTDMFNRTRIVSLKAEQEKLTPKINLKEQRKLGCNLLVELFRAEQDLARRSVAHLKKRFQQLKAAFLVATMEGFPEYEFSDILATLSILIQSLAISLFFARTLRFKKGITAVLIEKIPQSLLCRLRYIWYPFIVLLPLFILWLALNGYYYSSPELRFLVNKTFAISVWVFLLYSLALRALKLVVFIIVLACLWRIWESVFPAFHILQDIHFWSYNTVVDV